MIQDPAVLLADLVRIESHRTVDDIRDYLVETVENAEIHDASGCIVADKRPRDGSPHVLLNSHTDIIAHHVPFREENGVLYGRGSCDAKCCLNMLVTAFMHIEPDNGRVTLVLSPDEQSHSEGLYDYLTLENETDDFAITGGTDGVGRL